MNFGERLKKVRLEKDMTLLEVAEKLGKTEATVQRYESGNIKNLKSDVIEELALNEYADQYDYDEVVAYRYDGGEINWI